MLIRQATLSIESKFSIGMPHHKLGSQQASAPPEFMSSEKIVEHKLEDRIATGGGREMMSAPGTPVSCRASGVI